MPPICQTFVQNAWKKDLCSNCFKTKDEHGRPNSSYYSGYESSSSEGTTNAVSGRRKHPITSSIINTGGSNKAGERAIGEGRRRNAEDTTKAGSSPPKHSSRYVGVVGSGRIGYPRTYYGWKSAMGDASEASGLKSPSLIFRSDSTKGSSQLRSPGLIKGVSSSNLAASDASSPVAEDISRNTLDSTSSSSSYSSAANSPLPKMAISNTNSPRDFLASTSLFSECVQNKNHKNIRLSNGSSLPTHQSVPADRGGQYHTDVTCKALTHRFESLDQLPQGKKHLDSRSPYVEQPLRSRSADNVLNSGNHCYSEDGQNISDTEFCDSSFEMAPHVVENNEPTVEDIYKNGESTTEYSSSESDSDSETGVHQSYDITRDSSDGHSCEIDQRSNLSTYANSVTSETSSGGDSTASEDNCKGSYDFEFVGDLCSNNNDEVKLTKRSTEGGSADFCVPVQLVSTHQKVESPEDQEVESPEDSHEYEEINMDGVNRTIKSPDEDNDKNQTPLLKSSMRAAARSPRPKKRITFNTEEEVIGYGGDVDYSDDEEDGEDDDIDSLASYELTAREKILKRLTLQNTDFNAEPENFNSNVTLEEKHSELIKSFELANADYDLYADIERTYESCKSASSGGLDAVFQNVDRNEGKVKLKRSTPLVSVKPFVSRTSSANSDSPKVNPVLPMKNGELVRTRSDGSLMASEPASLQDIRPKYVSKEEEIVEKMTYCDEYFSSQKGQVTSFGPDPGAEKPSKLTYFGDEVAAQEKVTAIDDFVPRKEKVTSFDCPASSYPENKEESLTPDNNEPPLVKPVRQKRRKKLEPQAQGDTEEKVDGSRVSNSLVRNPHYEDSNSSSVKPCRSTDVGKTSSVEEVHASPKIENLQREVARNEFAQTLPKNSETSSIKQAPTSTTPSSNSGWPPHNLPPSEPATALQVPERLKKINSTVRDENFCPPQSSSAIKRRSSFLATQLGLGQVSGEALEQGNGESKGGRVAAAVKQISSCESSHMEAAHRKSDSDVQKNVEFPSSHKSEVPSQQQHLDCSQKPNVITSSQIQTLNHHGEEYTLHKSEQKDQREKESVPVKLPSATASNATQNEDVKFPQSSGTPGSNNGGPASQRNGHSSVMSSFGTPSHAILQDEVVEVAVTRSTYERAAPSENESRTSKDFLNEIKAPGEHVKLKPTASIQKSSLYATSPCVKSLPGSSKPIQTPRPPLLTNRLSSLDQSTSVSASNNVARNLSSTFASMAASAEGSEPNNREVVYDLPVTVTQTTKALANESLHYSTSPLLTGPVPDSALDADIYYEINLDDSEFQPTVPTLDGDRSHSSHEESPKLSFETKRSLINRTLAPTSNSKPSTTLTTQASRIEVNSPRKLEDSTLEATKSDHKNINGDSHTLGIVEDQTRSQAIYSNVSGTQVSKPRDPPYSLPHHGPGDLASSTALPLHGDLGGDADDCSSFTDDFDDDEEDEEGEDVPGEAAANLNSGLRRVADRSTSAAPLLRSSVGPTNYDASAILQHLVHSSASPLYSKTQVRSQSCPRDADHAVKPSPAAAPSKPSKFAFVKASFFRPTSPPPTTAPDNTPTTRGRDRTKKPSKFSLKKFLRLGGTTSAAASKEEDRRQFKEAMKEAERQAKKSKLNIIHPLDYHPTGVEVITRPEPTSPAYNYTNKYGFSPEKEPPEKNPPEKNSEGEKRRGLEQTLVEPPENLLPNTQKVIQTSSQEENPGLSASDGVQDSQEGSAVWQEGSAVRQEGSAVRQEGSAVRHNAEEIYRKSQLLHQEQMRQLDSRVSLQNNDHTSLQVVKSEQINRDSAPINRDSAQINGELAQINRNSAQINHDSAQINHDSAPINRDSAQIKRDSAPINSDSAPIHRDSAPINRDSAQINRDSAQASHPPPIHDHTATISQLSSQFSTVLTPTVVKTSTVQPIQLTNVPITSPVATVVTLRKNNSFVNRDTKLERRSSSTGIQVPAPVVPAPVVPPPVVPAPVVPALVVPAPVVPAPVVPAPVVPTSQPSNEGTPSEASPLKRQSCPHILGFNSEGRPKPPPPPRKASLEHKNSAPITEEVIYKIPNNKLVNASNNGIDVRNQLQKDIQERIKQMNAKSETPKNVERTNIPESPRNAAPNRPIPPPIPSSKPRIPAPAPGTALAQPKPASTSQSNSTHTQGISKPTTSPSYPTPRPASNTQVLSKGDVRRTSQSSRTSARPGNPPPPPASPSRRCRGTTSSPVTKLKFGPRSTNRPSPQATPSTPAKPTNSSPNSTTPSALRKQTKISPNSVPGTGSGSGATQVSSDNARTVGAPTGIVNASTGTVSTPTGMISAPTGMASAPTGMVSAPTGMISAPTGMVSIPTGMANAPGMSPIRPVVPVRSNGGGSNAGSSLAPPIPPRDSTYANLGDVRAPFTPRKPERTSSIGEEDTKKAPPRPPLSKVGLARQQQSEAAPQPDVAYDTLASLNREALSKILNKVCSENIVPPASYSAVAKATRSWQHIGLLSERPPVRSGHRVYHEGTAQGQAVTVLITPETSLEPLSLLALAPLAVLKEGRVGGTVWVLPRVRLWGVAQYAGVHTPPQPRTSATSHRTSATWHRTAALILLQLVVAFKQLQARGIEDASLDLLLLADTPSGNDAHMATLQQHTNMATPRLIVNVPPSSCPFPLPTSPAPLCQVVAEACVVLLGGDMSTGIAAHLPAPFHVALSALQQERAGSLTQAQCLLEAFVFGPQPTEVNTDVTSIQKWLDEERASLLKTLLSPCGQGSNNVAPATHPSTASSSKDGKCCDDEELCDAVWLQNAHGEKVKRCVTVEDKLKLMYLVRSNARGVAQTLASIS